MYTAAHLRSHFLAVLCVAALLATFLPSMPVEAQEDDRPDPWIREPLDACPPGRQVEGEGLVDEVVPDSGFKGYTWLEVDCLVWYGISSGVTPTRFRPYWDVTRGQMATFIANMLDVAAKDGETTALPPYDDENAFPDAADSVHVANINRLADAGIVNGGPGGAADDVYGPDLRVRRDQMGTFLNGAQAYMTGQPFHSNNDFFADDDRSVHEPNINAIAEHGITGGGDSPDEASQYEPARKVWRTQMASFIVRLLDVHVSQRRVATPAEGDPDRANESFAFREVPDTADVSMATVTNEGATRFHATGLTEEPVSVAVFACEDVWDVAARVTFRDLAEPTGEADLTVDDEGAVIEQVNGTPQLDRDNYVAGVEPRDDEVTFTVDSTTTDCAVAVAFVDGNANDALDLDDSGEPTEGFAASTPLLFLPPAAGEGPVDATVIHVDRVGGHVVAEADGDAAAYLLDDLDAFVVDTEAASFAEFSDRVTSGDRLRSTTYQADGDTTFELADVAPAPPVTTARLLEAGPDARPDYPWEVHLDWERSTTPGIDGYHVRRGKRFCQDSEEFGRRPERYLRSIWELGLETTQLVDPDIEIPYDVDVCYDYVVRAIDRRDESADTDASTETIRVQSDGPFLEDARVTRDARPAGRLGPGDRHRFAFSRRMSDEVASTDGFYYVSFETGEEKIWCRAAGSDGDPETTDCGLNRTDMTIDGRSYGPGQVLTVNIGTDHGHLREEAVAYPVTIHDALWNSAREDGDRVDLSGSPDNRLDVE